MSESLVDIIRCIRSNIKCTAIVLYTQWLENTYYILWVSCWMISHFSLGVLTLYDRGRLKPSQAKNVTLILSFSKVDNRNITVLLNCILRCILCPPVHPPKPATRHKRALAKEGCLSSVLPIRPSSDLKEHFLRANFHAFHCFKCCIVSVACVSQVPRASFSPQCLDSQYISYMRISAPFFQQMAWSLSASVQTIGKAMANLVVLEHGWFKSLESAILPPACKFWAWARTASSDG